MCLPLLYRHKRSSFTEICLQDNGQANLLPTKDKNDIHLKASSIFFYEIPLTIKHLKCIYSPVFHISQNNPQKFVIQLKLMSSENATKDCLHNFYYKHITTNLGKIKKPHQFSELLKTKKIERVEAAFSANPEKLKMHIVFED